MACAASEENKDSLVDGRGDAYCGPLQLYEAVSPDDPQVDSIATDMANELGEDNRQPEVLPKIARFELALMRFYEQNLGSRTYGTSPGPHSRKRSGSCPAM